MYSFPFYAEDWLRKAELLYISFLLIDYILEILLS